MEKSVLLRQYIKIVKAEKNTTYPGPEKQGMMIRKVSKMRSIGELHYSNVSVLYSDKMKGFLKY